MIIFDGRPVPAEDGDSVLTALVRAGIHPTGGGILCATGDCANCVAEIGGTAYVRTCQTSAEDGLAVTPHPDDEPPHLPTGAVDRPAPTKPVRNVHVDVAVIGRGTSGTDAAATAAADGLAVISFDAVDGEEVVGVFPGPLVVVRTPSEMIHAYAERVIVATGRAAIVPVCPGNDLDGILTPDGRNRLTEAGVELGRVVEIDEPPVRFHPDTNGRVRSVEIADGRRLDCDTVVVDLGRVPRDHLARMAAELPVEVVGGAAKPGDPAPRPTDGVVCPCNNTAVTDLRNSWSRGFTTMELLKRSSLAGTGTCQGSMCMPYLRSFIAAASADDPAIVDGEGPAPDDLPAPPPFTARPVVRQATLNELAAGRQFPAYPRTALDDEHRMAGASMDRIGGWWRPWTYGDTQAECDAVRKAVSMGDVGTLGKFVVSGPDAEAALQFLFPTDVATIKPGRARYALLLDERGYVLDDGMICREQDGDRFYVTVTSGGANLAEMWFRDWTSELDVRWLNATMSLGAINVTGPRATELLGRVGLDDPLPMLGHRRIAIAGVECRVARLSFTGEISYELHHDWSRSVELWRALLTAGADLGVRPHGLEALNRLRLEKGHVIVGQDTDYDSTPRRIDHQWALNLNKGDFVGRQAVVRTGRLPLDKRLVGLVVDGEPPFEGIVIHFTDGGYAGYVTSSAWSGALGRSVMLAWLDHRPGVGPDGWAEELEVDGRQARRVPVPFYDPDGRRARD